MGFVISVAIAVGSALTQESYQTSQGRSPNRTAIRCLGIFGSPEHLWKQGLRLSDFHINAVFVGHGELTEKLVNHCHREGAKIYAELGVFVGAATAQKHEELWPLNEHGEKQQQDDWYLGLCPNVPWFREAKLTRIAAVAEEFDIDGIWLDFIRFSGHWEVHAPRLEEGCFNEACLEAFVNATGIELPPGSVERRADFILTQHRDAWTRFKCHTIRDFCREAKGVLKSKRPDALLGAFVVPWTENDFEDAIHRIIAQDFVLLAEELDVFSPMSYHAMCGRPVEWIGSFNEYLTTKTHKEVWPIVQATEREAHYGDAPVNAETFRQALIQGLSGGAAGVLVFTIADCREDNGKLRVLREVYEEYAS
ncbi:MAG: hypothetical protein ACUVX8_12800 [Candidatus Zipacnadales bacterium]